MPAGKLRNSSPTHPPGAYSLPVANNTFVESQPGVSSLLESKEPGIRRSAELEFIGEATTPREAVFEGELFQALLSGQRDDGGFGVHPYRKWSGAHWRLVSLVELGAPPGDSRLQRAVDTVLRWLGERRLRVKTVDGLPRNCASIDGNALMVCCRLGLAEEDERVETLALDLISWQWPDGGWNCDLEASGRRSSFHESLIPAWGLHEFWRATGSERARDASLRTAELLLEHSIFKTLEDDEVIDPSWLRLRYPPYWHYGLLPALKVLARMGLVNDPRAAQALDILRGKRLASGEWANEGCWWRKPGSKGSGVEVVDWGRKGPNEMLTMDALRVLAAAVG